VLSTHRREAGAGGGVEDRIAVDAVGAVEVRDVAGLAKAVDAERDDGVAGDRAEPGQGRRMEVADGDEGRTRPQARQERFGDLLSPPTRAASQSRCRRSGEVTAKRPASGTSSATA